MQSLKILSQLGVVTGIWTAEAKNAVNHATTHGPTPTQSSVVENISSANMGESGFGATSTLIRRKKN